MSRPDERRQKSVEDEVRVDDVPAPHHALDLAEVRRLRVLVVPDHARDDAQAQEPDRVGQLLRQERAGENAGE